MTDKVFSLEKTKTNLMNLNLLNKEEKKLTIENMIFQLGIFLSQKEVELANILSVLLINYSFGEEIDKVIERPEGQTKKFKTNLKKDVIKFLKDIGGKEVQYQELQIEVNAVQQGGYMRSGLAGKLY